MHLGCTGGVGYPNSTESMLVFPFTVTVTWVNCAVPYTSFGTTTVQAIVLLHEAVTGIAKKLNLV